MPYLFFLYSYAFSPLSNLDDEVEEFLKTDDSEEEDVHFEMSEKAKLGELHLYFFQSREIHDFSSLAMEKGAGVIPYFG